MPTNDQLLKDYLIQFGYREPKQYPRLGSSGRNYDTSGGGVGEVLAKIVRGQIIKHKTQKQEEINAQAETKAREAVNQNVVAQIKRLREMGLNRLATVVETTGELATPEQINTSMKEMEAKRDEQMEVEQENQPIIAANQFNANQPMPADMTPMLSKDFQNGFPQGPQSIAPEYAKAATGGKAPEAASMVRQAGGDMNLFDFLTTLQSPEKLAGQEISKAFMEKQAGEISYEEALSRATKAYKLAHPVSTTPGEREYIRDRADLERVTRSEVNELIKFYRTYESQYEIARGKYEKALGQYNAQSEFDKKYNPLPEPKFDLKKMSLKEYLDANPEYANYEYGYTALQAAESGKEPPESVKSAVASMKQKISGGKVTVEAAIEGAKQKPELSQYLEWIQKELSK